MKNVVEWQHEVEWIVSFERGRISTQGKRRVEIYVYEEKWSVS